MKDMMGRHGTEGFAVYMSSSYTNDDPVEGMPIFSYWVDDSDSGETFFFMRDCYKEIKVWNT